MNVNRKEVIPYSLLDDLSCRIDQALKNTPENNGEKILHRPFSSKISGTFMSSSLKTPYKGMTLNLLGETEIDCTLIIPEGGPPKYNLTLKSPPEGHKNTETPITSFDWQPSDKILELFLKYLK